MLECSLIAHGLLKDSGKSPLSLKLCNMKSSREKRKIRVNVAFYFICIFYFLTLEFSEVIRNLRYDFQPHMNVSILNICCFLSYPLYMDKQDVK